MSLNFFPVGKRASITIKCTHWQLWITLPQRAVRYYRCTLHIFICFQKRTGGKVIEHATPWKTMPYLHQPDIRLSKGRAGPGSALFCWPWPWPLGPGPAYGWPWPWPSVTLTLRAGSGSAPGRPGSTLGQVFIMLNCDHWQRKRHSNVYPQVNIFFIV